MSKFVFFWAGPFSQWAKSPFTIGDQMFVTAEQWMMWNKAIMFDDTEIATKVLATNNPRSQKNLGRQIDNYVDAIWMERAYDIVVEGNMAKFQQVPEMMAELEKTRGKILVEASPYDRRWGIGMKAEDPGVEDPKNWKGENLLGLAITEVRIALLGS